MQETLVENGHVRIPNDLMDAIISIRLPGGYAAQLLFFVIRKTLGWNKKSDKISLAQIQEATGIAKHKIIETRIKLSDMNIISITQKGNEKTPYYCFNSNFKTWKSLPRKVTLPRKVIAVTQKGNAKSLDQVPIAGFETPKDTTTKDKTAINVKIQFNRETWSFENITQGRVDRWGKAYPGVDIWTEILRAGGYIENHPERKYSNYSSFLENWFKKAKPEIQESDEKPDSYYFS